MLLVFGVAPAFLAFHSLDLVGRIWNQYEAPPPRQAWAHSHLPEGSGGRGLKQQDWIGEELCQMDVEELCDIDKYR